MQLTLESVSIAGDGQSRLHDVTTTISTGDFVIIIGQNGAGKSTLLDVVAGLEKPTSGTVHTEGVKMAYCPQTPEIMLFGQSVSKELAFSLGVDERHIRATWSDLILQLSELGLSNVALDENPMTWSTGMQRRFAMALSFMQRPNVLLLDEPTAGLDGDSMDVLMGNLARMRGQCAMIVATHDIDTFAPLANRMWIVHQGQLSFDGTPQDVYRDSEALLQAGVALSPILTVQMACAETRPQRAVDMDQRENETSESLAHADTTSYRLRRLDPRSILFSTSIVTIATATVHNASGASAAVSAAMALLLWTRPKVNTIVRLTVAWLFFAVLASGVAGISLNWSQEHVSVTFKWLRAEQALIAVVPFWCYLQLGQLFTSRLTALELQTMIDWLLRLPRIPASMRHIVSVSAGMILRFIPTTLSMYQTQTRAAHIRMIAAFADGGSRQRKRKYLSRTNIHFLSRILTPLLIRLITFGERTVEALTARGIFHHPPQYYPFMKKWGRQSWFGVVLGIVGTAWIIWQGHRQHF